MDLDFSIKLPVTKEDILRHVSEEDIFCHYIGLPNIPRSLICSVLREDKHPTCGFFRGKSGILYMKDFATNDCLNCFALVSRMFNCNYYDALNIIASDLGIQGSLKAERSINFNKTSRFKTKPPTEIQIEVQEFTEADKKYWSQYNITPKLLEKYNVYSCKYVFLNDSVFAKSSDKCPMYGYYFGKKDNKELWRIYMPTRTAYRFLSNTTSNIIQGMRQLPHRGRVLVITKSMKDVICFRSFGIPAIAPNSEHLFVSDEQLERLKTRFDKIVVLYDNDRTGKLNMAKIRREHPELCYVLIPPVTKCKDFSDYVKAKGVAKAQNLIDEYMNWLNK